LSLTYKIEKIFRHKKMFLLTHQTYHLDPIRSFIQTSMALPLSVGTWPLLQFPTLFIQTATVIGTWRLYFLKFPHYLLPPWESPYDFTDFHLSSFHFLLKFNTYVYLKRLCVHSPSIMQQLFIHHLTLNTTCFGHRWASSGLLMYLL
jgi:hypothetical protein